MTEEEIKEMQEVARDYLENINNPNATDYMKKCFRNFFKTRYWNIEPEEALKM